MRSTGRGLGVLRIDAHDGAFGRGLGRFPLADVDIVGAAIESVDDQVMAVVDLVGQTEQLQGLRLMKFEDVYGRCYRGDLSQAEASEILGMSERTFRRWRERYGT